ncbi:MAG: diguanylate cyclase, partial [Desulfovibrionaceae bacterium]|nr:diguanylate cyclase [Desulfovibrionaceae bacterium]
HEVVSRLELAAGLKKAQFERWLDEQELDLVFLAGSPEIRGLSARLNLPESDPGRWEAVGGLCEYLIDAVRHHPNFNELFLIEPLDGRVAVSSAPARAGRFVPGHSYFKKGLEGTFVQPVHPSPETLEPVLTMSTPVLGPGGDLAGVLAAQLDLKRMDTGNGKSSGLGESGEMYFVDAYHVFVSGERFGRESFKRGVHTEAIDKAVAGADGSGLYDNYDRIPVIGVWRWLAKPKLALIVEMGQKQAFAPAVRLAGTIIGVGLALSTLLALAMFWLTKRTARPILAVAAAAEKVAGGDLDTTAPVMTQDEVGTLATAFNKMTCDLSRLYQELQSQVTERTAILRNSYDGIAMIRPNGEMTFYSPGMERIFGFMAWESRTIQDWAVNVFPDETDRREFLRTWEENLSRPSPSEHIFRFSHKDGHWRWARFQMSRMPGGDLVINGQDITDLKKSEEYITYLALHDPLTGLPNRQLFLDRLEQALKHARRYGANLAILFIDLDEFKEINDSLGHALGDEALRETAKRLTACLRQSDSVARIGGDEFVVILPDLKDPRDAALIADKIARILGEPSPRKGLPLSGASIGISTYPEDGEDEDTLLVKADKAMYKAKKSGGGCYRFFRDLKS